MTKKVEVKALAALNEDVLLATLKHENGCLVMQPKQCQGWEV